MKYLIAIVMILSSVDFGYSQSDITNYYSRYAFEDYDFREFGGPREFAKKIYKRISYPLISRKEENQGEIKVALRHNGAGDYDVFTESVSNEIHVELHFEIERVLDEVKGLRIQDAEEKYLVEMLFTFEICWDCQMGKYELGEFYVTAIPLPEPQRSMF